MSCINVDVKSMNKTPVLSIDRIGGISANVYMLGEPINFSIFDAGFHPTIRCSVVCSVADLHYINVSPSDVQWITEEYGVVYTVESDTNWIVVTT